ncbi:MAG: hypothetical protein ABIJ85_00280 [bacterium]
MTERKIVYRGKFTDRKTEQFRQVEKSVQRLLDVGVPGRWINSEKIINHEKAHIVGHEPGRSGRMVARVYISWRKKIKSWEIEHEVDLGEKLTMSGKEMLEASLAPAFVEGRKCFPPSYIDIASAIGGVIVLGLERLSNKSDKKT